MPQKSQLLLAAIPLTINERKRLSRISKRVGKTEIELAKEGILLRLDDMENMIAAEQRVARVGVRIPLEELERELNNDFLA